MRFYSNTHSDRQSLELKLIHNSDDHTFQSNPIVEYGLPFLFYIWVGTRCYVCAHKGITIKIAMVMGYADLLVMIDGCKKEDFINYCFMIRHLPSS